MLSPALSLSSSDAPRSLSDRFSLRRTSPSTLIAVPCVAIPFAMLALTWGAAMTLTPDSFSYLSAARSLTQTGGFSHERLVQPPGFPLILAPFMLIGDLPLLPLRVLFTACWTVTAALAIALHRRELGWAGAGFVGLLLATSPALHTQSQALLSESVYLPVSLIVLLVLDRWWREGPRGSSDLAMGAALCALACLIRSMGLVLVPIMALMLLLRRTDALASRWRRTALYLGCVAVPTLSWQVWQAAHPPVAGYVTSWTAARQLEETDATGLGLYLHRAVQFGPERLGDIKAALVPHRLGWRLFAEPWDGPSSWAIGGLMVLLCGLHFWKTRSPLDAYVLGSLAMLALWPWQEGQRMVLPFVPLLVGYGVWAVHSIASRPGVDRWRHGRRSRIRWSVGIAAAVLIALQCGELGLQAGDARHRSEAYQSQMSVMRTLAEWQATHEARGGDVLAVVPRGHMSKVRVVGGAYLARRPIEVIDADPAGPLPATRLKGCTALIHESLFGRAALEWDAAPVERVADMIVFAGR